MKLGLYGALIVAMTMVLVPGPANAIIPGSSYTHGYNSADGFVCDYNQNEIGTKYAGFTYSAGSKALVSPCYNTFGYPACEGNGVGVNLGSGSTTITADLVHQFSRVSGCCNTASPFANPNGIRFAITDVLGGVASAQCKSNYGAFTTFSVTATFPVAYTLTISDTANYFTWDRLVFSF